MIFLGWVYFKIYQKVLLTISYLFFLISEMTSNNWLLYSPWPSWTDLEYVVLYWGSSERIPGSPRTWQFCPDNLASLVSQPEKKTKNKTDVLVLSQHKNMRVTLHGVRHSGDEFNRMQLWPRAHWASEYVAWTGNCPPPQQMVAASPVMERKRLFE